MKQLRLIAILILAVVVAVLILQNTEPVETRLLFATVEMPRALLLLTTVLVGFALGILTALVWMRARTPAPRQGDE